MGRITSPTADFTWSPRFWWFPFIDSRRFTQVFQWCSYVTSHGILRWTVHHALGIALDDSGHAPEAPQFCGEALIGWSRPCMFQLQGNKDQTMWVQQCHLHHPLVITIFFIGGINQPFPVMDGLWRCFTDITSVFTHGCCMKRSEADLNFILWVPAFRPKVCKGTWSNYRWISRHGNRSFDQWDPARI